jgi:valyl-tRNA synthetase
MSNQLKSLGFSYDWTREVAAHRPDYYRWNQWFFLEMLKRDLAYRSRREVNWCDSCETVLANEQVEAGRCWRCDSVVSRRELDQWFLRLSRYTGERRDLARLTAGRRRCGRSRRTGSPSEGGGPLFRRGRRRGPGGAARRGRDLNTRLDTISAPPSRGARSIRS